MRPAGEPEASKAYEGVDVRLLEGDKMLQASADLVFLHFEPHRARVRLQAFKHFMADLPAPDAAALFSLFLQDIAGQLPDVTFQDAGFNVLDRNVPLNALEPYPLWQAFFYAGEQRCGVLAGQGA